MATPATEGGPAAGRRGQQARAQREESRRRLLDAAAELFAERGYIASSIDEIAQEAGVSRQTFYRHFDGKLAIGVALLEQERERTAPLWRMLGNEEARDAVAVERWLDQMLAARVQPRMSRALIEMGVVEPGFLDRARVVVGQVVDTLAERVPAFRTGGGDADARRRGEAWLVIYHMLEQFSLLGLGVELMDRALLVRILAFQFADFVRRADAAEELALHGVTSGIAST